MLVAVDCKCTLLDEAGADTVGPFAGFAPVCTEPEPGAFENLALGRRGDAVEDYPTGIGEQHGMAGTGELLAAGRRTSR